LSTVSTDDSAGFQSSGAIKKRFEKNRDKLFTFLVHDGVPWNNNNAEHAVKAFAMLRQVIQGVTSEKGIRDYLVLLSISQTCKYKELDFLDVLRSGEKTFFKPNALQLWVKAATWFAFMHRAVVLRFGLIS
jgi:hypothetical protein